MYTISFLFFAAHSTSSSFIPFSPATSFLKHSSSHIFFVIFCIDCLCSAHVTWRLEQTVGEPCTAVVTCFSANYAHSSGRPKKTVGHSTGWPRFQQKSSTIYCQGLFLYLSKMFSVLCERPSTVLVYSVTVLMTGVRSIHLFWLSVCADIQLLSYINNINIPTIS